MNDERYGDVMVCKVDVNDKIIFIFYWQIYLCFSIYNTVNSLPIYNLGVLFIVIIVVRKSFSVSVESWCERTTPLSVSCHHANLEVPIVSVKTMSSKINTDV